MTAKHETSRERKSIAENGQSVSSRNGVGTYERLRTALQDLLEDPPATLDEPDTDAEVIIKMRAIARGALHPNRPRHD